MRILNAFILSAIFLAWLAQSVGANDFSLTRTAAGIRIHAADQPLSQVLKSIHAQSGIGFSLPKELESVSMTIAYEAADWKTLVNGLLQDFSKIEFWKEPVETSHVKIIGLGDYQPPPGVVPASALIVSVPAESQPATSKPEQRVARRDPAPEREPPPIPQSAEAVHPEHPLAKLPDFIFMEPAILEYLQASKVDIPEEFKTQYGLEDEPNRSERNSYAIPGEIYNHPAFDAYLNAVGLSKPPQFRDGNAQEK